MKGLTSASRELSYLHLELAFVVQPNALKNSLGHMIILTIKGFGYILI